MSAAINVKSKIYRDIKYKPYFYKKLTKGKKC